MSPILRAAILTGVCLLFPLIFYAYISSKHDGSRAKRYMDSTFDPDQD